MLHGASTGDTATPPQVFFHTGVVAGGKQAPEVHQDAGWGGFGGAVGLPFLRGACCCERTHVRLQMAARRAAWICILDAGRPPGAPTTRAADRPPQDSPHRFPRSRYLKSSESMSRRSS